LPLILTSQKFRDVSGKTLDFERRLSFSYFLEAVHVGLAEYAHRSTTEDTHLLLLLGYESMHIFFDNFKGLFFCVTFIHKVSLLLYEYCTWMVY